MAAVTDTRVLYSQTKSKNHSKINDNDCHNHKKWKSEIITLKSEVESKSEAIKILTEESDTFGANKQNSKLTYSDIVTATQRGKYTQQGKNNNSGCHNCGEWKSEINTLKSEIKSLSEAIKIITGETKPSDANIKTTKLTHTDPVGTTQCSKCNQLELQLQATLDEVSSLKAIVNVLNDDNKSSKPPIRTNRDTNNLWTVVSANNSRSSWTDTQPKPFSCDASYSLQYAVPTSNRYAALSSRQQTNSTKFLPNIEQQSRRFHETNLN